MHEELVQYPLLAGSTPNYSNVRLRVHSVEVHSPKDGAPNDGSQPVPGLDLFKARSSE